MASPQVPRCRAGNCSRCHRWVLARLAFILAALVRASSLAHATAPDAEGRVPFLSNLQDVAVTVDIIEPPTMPGPERAEAIRAEIERKLRDGGVRVADRANAQTYRSSAQLVATLVFADAEGSCLWATRLSLRDVVPLERTPDLLVSAVTWRTPEFFTLGFDPPQTPARCWQIARKHVDGWVDQFVEDFRRASVKDGSGSASATATESQGAEPVPVLPGLRQIAVETEVGVNNDRELADREQAVLQVESERTLRDAGFAVIERPELKPGKPRLVLWLSAHKQGRQHCVDIVEVYLEEAVTVPRSPLAPRPPRPLVARTWGDSGPQWFHVRYDRDGFGTCLQEGEARVHERVVDFIRDFRVHSD
jgi:hypothetical protein